MTEQEKLRGDRVLLRAVTLADGPELRRILETPAVAARWSEPVRPGWPLPDDEDEHRYIIECDGTVAGLIQSFEETDPDYRHAAIDIFLDPAYQGRGLGTDAVRTLARQLFAIDGHHRLSIDPAADNALAIRCYSKVGFRPVGILRRYERDADSGTWHDCLLMDLLVEEFRAG